MQGGHGARRKDLGSACATCTSGEGFEWPGRFFFWEKLSVYSKAKFL